MDSGNALIHFHPLPIILHVIPRQVGIHLEIHTSLQGLLARILPLYLMQGFLNELAVHVIAYGRQVTVLFRPQNIACAPNLQIPHGNAEACTKLRKLPNGRQTLFRRFGKHFIRPHGKVGISLPVAASHTATELIQLAQAKAIRIKDNQGIGRRYIQPTFDDGGAQQHVIAAGIEVHHHVFQAVFLHLPMGNTDSCLRHQRTKPSIELFNGLHSIVQEVHLSAPGQFP